MQVNGLLATCAQHLTQKSLSEHLRAVWTRFRYATPPNRPRGIAWWNPPRPSRLGTWCFCSRHLSVTWCCKPVNRLPTHPCSEYHTPWYRYNFAGSIIVPVHNSVLRIAKTPPELPLLYSQKATLKLPRTESIDGSRGYEYQLLPGGKD